MQGCSLRFDMQGLEKRLLFAAAPAEPRADSLGKAFDSGERQALLDSLTNLSASEHATLKRKLKTGVGAFDSALLSYMRNRSGPNFFFNPANTASIGQFINDNNLSDGDILTHANAVTDSHLFPEQGSSSDYTIQEPAKINWVSPGGSTDPEFLHSMNRQSWWIELAWTSIVTGDAKYANEIEYELASWSQQNPTMDPPASWSKSDKSSWELDTSLRAESWTWAYFSLLDNAHFTPAENSLFMYKLMQTGDYLYQAALNSDSTDYQSNKAISLGKGLLYIGEMFPEFNLAGKWATEARNTLFASMDAQIYPDGSQFEQSPGYAYNVSDDLLDAMQIDKVNNVSWSKKFRVKLANLVDSFWQFLSPNGTRPAIGDTYRNDSRGVFDKADIVLGTTRWPQVKVRERDVFALGESAVKPYVTKPAFQPSLGDRGDTYAMTDSGNYIMRSGNDANARQIIFNAGPKGGSHGHYDLLNFELSGYGRPLISDPGAYKYDTSADRAYVISTQAHNTINADGLNTADIEGAGNPAIDVTQWKTGTDASQITASHDGYDYLSGSPVLTRSMWYDMDGTILIVDWADGGATHNYQESFNLQTDGDNNNVSVNDTTLTAQTRYSSGGNVKIQAITTKGETAVKGPLTFVTNTASGDYKDPDYRVTFDQSGKFVVFVTLITAYDGATAPNTTASLITDGSDGGTVRVALSTGGKSQEVDFSRPVTQRLDSIATTRGTYNDIAFDSRNQLHMVYADRDTGDLMYSVRDDKGNWSIPSVIDLPASSNGAGGYQYISLAIDQNSEPGVAYFDGWNGDLKYAHLDSDTHSWKVQTVDSKGSTGLYTSLAFSRHNGPVISYYNRTESALELAQSEGTGFSIATIDSAGDVGRSSSLVLDPNVTDATKWAIGYEDTTNGNYKFALQGLFDGGKQVNGFTNYVVDDLSEGGGYVSLAYYDTGKNGAERYKPAMSYYDAGNSALKYAQATDAGSSWETQTVASAKVQGLYTNLLFDAGGKVNIFYYDRSDNEAMWAVLKKGNWTFTPLRGGGREMHISQDDAGNIAYSSLNEATGHLNVFII